MLHTLFTVEEDEEEDEDEEVTQEGMFTTKDMVCLLYTSSDGF